MKLYKGLLYKNRKVRINKHKYKITKCCFTLPF